MPPENGPLGGGAPPPTRRSAGMSRLWLYVLALVVLGVLVAPIAWEHKGISRREKLLVIALGGLQTLAAVVVSVLFFFWFKGWLSGQMKGL